VFDASYRVRIVLGLVAGLMLALLLPLQGNDSQSPTLQKPLIALLGGFSASLVHQILQRLVDTVGSAFDGDRRQQQQREQELARTDTQHAIAESHIDVAAQLVHVRDQLAQGGSPQHINELLTTLLDRLLTRDKAANMQGGRELHTS
jgi:cytochrome c-type biogenesis protein CcmH/NrfF